MNRVVFSMVLVTAMFGGYLVGLSQSDAEPSPGPVKAQQPKPVPERCIDGVVYYFHTEDWVHGKFGYMAPKFNRASRVVPC